jgi:hypothetical protein
MNPHQFELAGIFHETFYTLTRNVVTENRDYKPEFIQEMINVIKALFSLIALPFVLVAAVLAFVFGLVGIVLSVLGVVLTPVLGVGLVILPIGLAFILAAWLIGQLLRPRRTVVIR